jgi:hypothetical protein
MKERALDVIMRKSDSRSPSVRFLNRVKSSKDLGKYEVFEI